MWKTSSNRSDGLYLIIKDLIDLLIDTDLISDIYLSEVQWSTKLYDVT